VPSLAEEFYSHDLAITAGGLTPFEASANGLPCFIITAEPFEIKNALFLEKLGCSKYLGHLKADKLDSISNIVDMHLNNMSLNGLNSFDDKAGIRIIKEIESLR
jgi:spore coat polysaccharide biosynthesis predicted glycosyltransferase SpsG